jgi:chromosome partitioning protein
MILTVGNTKGGVGKTTLALNIAIARALSGREVWLIDGDRQATAQTAISIRFDAGHQPGIACANYADGVTLRAQVKQQGHKFQDIIIDAGGRDSTALRAALVLTDVLLVPFHPRSFEVWALDDIAALVDEARSVRDGLSAYAMLNCADPALLAAEISAQNPQNAIFLARQQAPIALDVLLFCAVAGRITGVALRQHAQRIDDQPIIAHTPVQQPGHRPDLMPDRAGRQPIALLHRADPILSPGHVDFGNRPAF